MLEAVWKSLYMLIRYPPYSIDMRTTCLFPKVFFFLCVFVFMSASFFVFFSSVDRWGGVVVDRLLRLLVGSASRQKYCQDRSLAVTPSGKPVMQAMKPFSVTHPCFFVCFSSAYKKNHSNVNASNYSTNHQKKKNQSTRSDGVFFFFFFTQRQLARFSSIQRPRNLLLTRPCT